MAVIIREIPKALPESDTDPKSLTMQEIEQACREIIQCPPLVLDLGNGLFRIGIKEPFAYGGRTVVDKFLNVVKESGHK